MILCHINIDAHPTTLMLSCVCANQNLRHASLPFVWIKQKEFNCGEVVENNECLQCRFLQHNLSRHERSKHSLVASQVKESKYYFVGNLISISSLGLPFCVGPYISCYSRFNWTSKRRLFFVASRSHGQKPSSGKMISMNTWLESGNAIHKKIVLSRLVADRMTSGLSYRFAITFN